MLTIATRNNALRIAEWLATQGAIVTISAVHNGWRLDILILK